MKQKQEHPWRTGDRPVGAPRGNTAAAEIPTEALRRAFEKSGLSKDELARRMGWVRPNICKLNRALGYKPDCTRGKKRSQPRMVMSYELAVKICKALDASPFECGI